ncbi:MAG TPA: hypothetical protein VFH31_20880 [Pyrinomonadaceae bacterium]|nr:hypothetical protein [Pyrinomonadaceae bacterium]
MPEQISKYPDVTLEVLKGAGALCGEGAPQKILTQCPAERFCSLPTGEVCVYGIKEIPQMTQITPQELAHVVSPRAQQDGAVPGLMSGIEGLMLGVVFIVGLALGMVLHKLRGNSSRSGMGDRNRDHN